MSRDDPLKFLERRSHRIRTPNPDTWEYGALDSERRHASQAAEVMEPTLPPVWPPATEPSDLSTFFDMFEYRVQETSVADRISDMEKRLKDQEHSIRELESRINSALPKDHVEHVLEHTEKIFAGLKYIIRAHYVVLQDGNLQVIFIHSLDDRVEALTSICKKVREIMRAFPNTEVTPIILHKDEVRKEHLINTTLIFEKM